MGPKIRQNNFVKELPGKEQDILDLKQKKKEKKMGSEPKLHAGQGARRIGPQPKQFHT